MKRYASFFIIVLIACFLLPSIYGYCLTTVNAAEIADVNTAYSVTATGTANENGSAVAYYRNKNVVSISFDLLKNVKSGSFGVVLAESADGFESYDAMTNYVVFSADGTPFTSNGAEISATIILERGNNYLFVSDGKKLSVQSRSFYQTEYKEISAVTFPDEKRGVIGVCAFSDGIDSANCIIDNLCGFNAKGETVFYNGFNYGNIGDRGTVYVYSSLGGYAEKYDMQTYNVAFVDEQGDLLSAQKVCEYNYAALPDAPNKKGYRFIGWSGDYACITENSTFYPVYEKAKGGCGGNIGGSSVGLFVLFMGSVAVTFFGRRKKDEKN